MSQPAPVIPPPLPAGTSLADLSDRDVQERAQYVADLFEDLCNLLNDFVTQDFPADEDEGVCLAVVSVLEFAASRLSGARAWTEHKDPAVRLAIQDGGLAGRPENVPAIILASVWCDVALASQEHFWATVRAHEGDLKKLPGWQNVLRRFRAN